MRSSTRATRTPRCTCATPQDSLELEIVDDGKATPASAAGGGHGLVGMRERVALYGGRLDAGRRAGGGFAIHVLLPIR